MSSRLHKTEPRRLLTIGNPKTVKGEKDGWLTAILHLAPYDLSGRSVCPDATPECVDLCLNTAGRGGIIPHGKRTNAIQRARVRKTREFFSDRPRFLADLAHAIALHERRARRDKLRPAVRLNGTSDLPFERIAPELFARFAGVRFYDYTKSFRRMVEFQGGEFPENYSLTFSRSELNTEDSNAILTAGGNVAIVFDTKRGRALPARYCPEHGADMERCPGWPVFDGDISDLRFLDPAGVIVGLRAKGRARKATAGGFVLAAA